MTAAIGSYAAYKVSGVPWLGYVPEHWAVSRGKWLFRHKKDLNSDGLQTNVLSLTLRGVVNNDPNNPEGLVPKDYRSYQRFEQDDLVFKLIDLENLRTSRVGLVHEDGIMSSAYVRLVRTHGGVQRFFFHQYFDLYQRGIFNQLGAGVRSTLGPMDLLDLPVLVPSQAEQAAIVRFLDYADRNIRRYIAAKRKLIALLNEQKQVIIRSAVTRGLNPNVRLRPSGIGALGEMPAHWAVLPLKRWVATKITDGPHETPEFVDDGIPFLSAESMTNGHLDFTRRRGFVSREAHENYCKKLRPERDDIFMCKSGATTGKVAIVDSNDEFSVWSPLALIRADRRRVIPRLLWWVLQDQYIQRQVQETWSYGTQPNLSMASMERLLVVLPPIEEQAALVDDLEQTAGRIVTAMGRAEREIDLSREYRTRLIADVATGKLDVREAAVRLPDEIEEAELIAEVDALTEGAAPERAADLAAVDEAEP